LAPAVREVIANRSMRDAQIALAGARAIDLAQLVVVSTFLFSRDGATSVATYGVVRTLAPAVGVPVVTALGCRLGNGGLLRLVGIVAAIGSFAMAAVVAAGSPSIGVLAAAGVVGVALGCFRPVISAALPALVRSPAELLASNAATGFFDGASTLVGPVVGSVVVVVLGVAPLLALTGVGMIAVGLIAGRLPTAPGARAAEARRDGGRIAEYLAGARQLAASPAARLVGVLGTAQTMVRGAISVIVVVFAGHVLRTGAPGVGALYGAMGVGGLVGLPVAVVVVDHLGVHRSLATGLATWGAPLALCALAATPEMALLLFATIGVGNAVVDIGYYSAMQRAVAERVLTRVLGVIEAMFQAGLAVGALAGAVLVDRVGPRPALLVVGLVLPGLAMLTTPRLSSLDRDLAGRDGEIATLRTRARFASLPLTVLDDLAARTPGVRMDELILHDDAQHTTVVGPLDGHAADRTPRDLRVARAAPSSK
jgi:MFS family permease